MKTSSLIRILLTTFALIALALAPQTALAQHGGGGHGGGGGFHGGGGGGFHGGAAMYSGGHYSSGAVRAYGYGGYRGGYYARGGYYYGRGWYGGRWYGGRYWGYPYYGWGWGWGFGWGWPYYWGWGYPYGYYYGYPSYYYYPDNSSDQNGYPYPYTCPPGYQCIQDGSGNPPQGNPPDDPPGDPKPNANPNVNPGTNPKPWRTPAPAGTGAPNLPNSTITQNMTPGRVLSVDRIATTPASYQTTATTRPLYGQMRPEVIRAMATLREMPPYAREREIETGRYSNFSPQEKELLRNVR